MSSKRLEELGAIYDLESASWANPKRSPHIWRQLVGNEQQSHAYYSARALALERRALPTSPTAEYHRRKGEERTLLHWGQRKLLIAEIEFLTLHGHLADTVVYAGAAPGTHITVLAVLFPNHAFHLYDPAPFTVREGDNVHLHQEMFTDEVAASWRAQDANHPKRVLFVCDIRSASLDVQTQAEFEERVAIDMQAQRHWCELMEPAMASLKFCPPWNDEKLEYYAGDVYFQVWAGQTSTEGRLFTDCSTLTHYDNRGYEKQLFFYNTISRLALHAHDIEGIEGLDYCCDCASEVLVLARYIERFGLPGDREVSDARHAVGALCLLITRTMGKRTLAEEVDYGLRHDQIVSRQWVVDEKTGLRKPAYQAEVDIYLEGSTPTDEHSPAALLMADLIAIPSIAEALSSF